MEGLVGLGLGIRMAQESDKYRLLFEEERRLREEAEQRLHATQQDLHDERKQKQPTTIFEFLDGCHTHLFRGLTVREAKESTKGILSNPDGRLRPERIRQWPDFAAEQGRICTRMRKYASTSASWAASPLRTTETR